MPDQLAQLAVADMEDWVGAVAMRFYELSAQRIESDDDQLDPDTDSTDDDDTTVHVEVKADLQAEDTGSRFAVRLKIEVVRQDSIIRVDCAAQFTWKDGKRPAELGPFIEDQINDVGTLFVQEVGLPYLVSYIRPAIDQQARTMELPVLTLPIDYFRGARIELGERVAKAAEASV
ncbi:hypothetical protein ACWDUD_01650 [Rhodococcus sp. NPDC003382]